MMEEDARRGRLLARPLAGVDPATAPLGLRPLGLAATRDGYVYVPTGYRAARPAPLVTVLHGAGEDARDGLALLRAQADGAGLILLAPSSREYTWDLVAGRGRYGPDVAAIDEALEQILSRYVVDPARDRGWETPVGNGSSGLRTQRRGQRRCQRPDFPPGNGEGAEGDRTGAHGPLRGPRPRGGRPLREHPLCGEHRERRPGAGGRAGDHR